MKQERIAVADMLPDKKNPRKKFEGIKELADSFAITPGRPGEPFNPPIVVQDGTKYRIVEGHRRHKAMKRLKTETCLAIIAEDFDEANTLAVMLATDEKQKLTDVEKSQGVQTMLITGVDPTVVEKAAYLPKGSAKKVKAAMDAAGDGAEQMSMERLFAIAEFEGDEEAVKELSECSEGQWQAVVDGIRKRHEREALVSALSEVLAKHGVEIVESRPDGYTCTGFFTGPERLDEYLQGIEDVKSAKAKIDDYYRVDVNVYLPAAEPEIDPEEEKRKEERERHASSYQDGARRRMAWVASKIARPTDELPNICAEVEAGEERFDWQWNRVFDYLDAEADIPAGPSEIVMNVFGLENVSHGLYRYYMNDDYDNEACAEYVHLIDLLKSDGYEPDETEAAMYEEARAVLAENDLEA